MARRIRFKKESPERGWIVGLNGVSIIYNSASALSGMVTLFDFADIDPEGVTGMIQKDKSDWYIKRVIIDCYAVLGPINLNNTDVARIYQVALATGSDDDLIAWNASGTMVLSDTFYDQTQRILQTWTRPVYAGAVIPYSQPVAESISSIATEDHGGTDVFMGYGAAAPFWGPSSIHADIDVSNAGLRQDGNLEFCVSCPPGPGTYDWDTGDQLGVSCYYRVLLQKRRGA